MNVYPVYPVYLENPKAGAGWNPKHKIKAVSGSSQFHSGCFEEYASHSEGAGIARKRMFNGRCVHMYTYAYPDIRPKRV